MRQGLCIQIATGKGDDAVTNLGAGPWTRDAVQVQANGHRFKSRAFGALVKAMTPRHDLGVERREVACVFDHALGQTVFNTRQRAVGGFVPRRPRDFAGGEGRVVQRLGIGGRDKDGHLFLRYARIGWVRARVRAMALCRLAFSGRGQATHWEVFIIATGCPLARAMMFRREWRGMCIPIHCLSRETRPGPDPGPHGVG